jgi:hypothetical protein
MDEVEHVGEIVLPETCDEAPESRNQSKVGNGCDATSCSETPSEPECRRSTIQDQLWETIQIEGQHPI